jgi:predicted DNA-binding protein YlxM (UPF0122 family)
MNTFAQAVKDVQKKCSELLKTYHYKLSSLPKKMPPEGV